MAVNLKAIHTYSDPGLDKQKFFEHELTIRFNADMLAFCIFHADSNKFLHLQAYDLSDPGKGPYIPGDTENCDTQKLSELLEGELKWLQQAYSRVRILYERGKSSLVPEALFSEEHKKDIFEFNIAPGPVKDQEIRYDRLNNAAAYNIYQLPQNISGWLSEYFPGAAVYHHSSVLTESLLLKYRNAFNEKKIFVNTGSTHLDIVQLKDKKLEYYNSFRYNTAEDFMYYLVFVIEQLKLNPEVVEVILVGEIERQSSLVDLIHKYIRNISFIGRNADFRYSFVFDQLPGHYYYNLLNASLCE
jgi:hypothetical protein